MIPLIALVAAALPCTAQAIVPLNTLLANSGSLTAGPITFSNFQVPPWLPDPTVGVRPPLEFGDIGVSATTNVDGTVTLSFVGIDPVTGLPQELAVSAAGAKELVRWALFSFTVVDSALRVHSMERSVTTGPNSVGENGIFTSLTTIEPSGMPNALGASYSMATPFTQPMPGGNLATFNMAAEFGLNGGSFGSVPSSTIGSFNLKYSLVQVGSPVPIVVPSLSVGGAPYMDPSGLGIFAINPAAQDGGVTLSLSSSNPAAFVLPATVTVPQGYTTGVFRGQATVDVPTDVFVSLSLNDVTQTRLFTAVPPSPLVVSSITGITISTSGASLRVLLSRNSFSVATVQLTSSNPALAPVPASVLVAQASAAVPVAFKIVANDTPVTFSATLNGVTQSTSITIPRTVDTVAIGKAELVTKNGSLKVDASSTVPSAVLTLFNSATGQAIGIMTNTGLSGTGARYSFQGTVPPVTTLLLKSSFNGTSTAAVSQK